jgi:hypothetical protein
MIKITNLEYVKASGDFKLEGLHVKRFDFGFPTHANSQQSLTIELVPFAYMDDGSRIYDIEKVYKVVIPHVESYITTHALASVGAAYYATEAGIADILGVEHPNLNAVFVAPQGA